MGMMNILAQINTGVPWLDWLADDILLANGPITLLAVVVLVYLAVTFFNMNKRADANETFVLDTAKESRETKDELIKVKDEFHAFKLSSASEKGIQDGRIIELSDTVKRQQEKFDEREKALQREIDRLTKESQENKEKLERLHEELIGKDKTIEALTKERDAHKETIDTLQREKLDLESQIDSLKATIAEQSEQIISLGKELVEAKTIGVTTPAIPVTNDDTLPLDEATLNQVTEEKKEDAA